MGGSHIGGLRVHPGFWVALAWLLWREEDLFLPLLSACALHEGGHLAAAALLGIPVAGCSLSALGAELTLPRACPLWQEITVLLSGCAVNLLCAAVLTQRPGWSLWAACHLVLAVFNLLPVSPLDGGQVSRLLWESACPGRTGWMLWHLFAALAYGGLIAFGLRRNWAAALAGLWLAVQTARTE